MGMEMNMRKTALIGHTGFVGGNLARQHSFDDCYHSRNIDDIAGRSYDLIVCAGAPAQKWLANKDPVSDRAALDRLMTPLRTVQTARFILISTVDVYPSPVDVDEASPIDLTTQHAYGKHRYELEQFVRASFPCLIVRLPGLFGEGLKKNIIYDFLHQNQVANIHAQSSFQFYGLDSLWRDIGIAATSGVDLINFATEPVTVGEVASEAFGFELTQTPPGPPARYDFRSRHAALYGGSGGYLYSRELVLEALRAFVRSERKRLHASSHIQPRLAS
jgi:hypothetical protein